MIVDIEFVEEVDRTPEASYYDYSQGTTWVNDKIYRLVSDDGSEQFIAIGIVHNSYGDVSGATEPKLVTPTKKTVNVWS